MTNIIRYSDATRVFFECAMVDKRLRVSFRDNGIPFDPTAYAPQEKELDLLDSGGMGLSMIRQIVSSMHYERSNQENTFSMEFPADG